MLINWKQIRRIFKIIKSNGGGIRKSSSPGEAKRLRVAGKKCWRSFSECVWRLPNASGGYAGTELFLITVRRKWSDLWYAHGAFAVEIACNFAALGAVIDPTDQDGKAFVTPPPPSWRGTMSHDSSFTFSCLAVLVGIRLWCATCENITSDAPSSRCFSWRLYQCGGGSDSKSTSNSGGILPGDCSLMSLSTETQPQGHNYTALRLPLMSR